VVFSRPDLKLAGVFAPRGKAVAALREGIEGYVVSGSWQWGSGSRNADYVSGGCVILDGEGKPRTLPDGSPEVRSMLFDASQVKISDNWHVMGLRGTGSNEFSVHEVFVPARRSAALIGGTPLPLPLYKFPLFGLLSLGIAAVALGIARLAIDSLVELATQKTPQGSTRMLAERSSTQEHVARAEARIRSARSFLLESIDNAWRAALKPGAIAAEQRRDIRLSTTHAADEAAAIVNRMYHLAGGTSVYDSSPIQRCLRDIQVATQHMMVSESTYEVCGRMFLGLPTNVSTL
jgi:indole-3-acetate monooxygenase